MSGKARFMTRSSNWLVTRMQRKKFHLDREPTGFAPPPVTTSVEVEKQNYKAREAYNSRAVEVGSSAVTSDVNRGLMV